MMLIFLCIIGFVVGAAPTPIPPSNNWPIQFNISEWQMTSSAFLDATTSVGLNGHQNGSWFPVVVPCTVIAGELILRDLGFLMFN